MSSKKHRVKIPASCYVDIRSQEYDKYTPLYKRLSLSKSVFFACSDLVFLQNTFNTCRQHHHITIDQLVSVFLQMR
jgi:hypothetical protein